MINQYLLIILAVQLSAVVNIILGPLWMLLRPQCKPLGCFKIVFIYFPVGALVSYGLIFLVYRWVINPVM